MKSALPAQPCYSADCSSIQPLLAANQTFKQAFSGIDSGTLSLAHLSTQSLEQSVSGSLFQVRFSQSHNPCVSRRYCERLQAARWPLLLGRWHFSQTLLQKDMSLCAPIQDNQVILVHMPRSISPPLP